MHSDLSPKRSRNERDARTWEMGMSCDPNDQADQVLDYTGHSGGKLGIVLGKRLTISWWGDTPQDRQSL